MTNDHNEHSIHDAKENLKREDIGEMRKLMEQATAAGNEFYDRAEQAINRRYCFWEGQSLDGRKHGTGTQPPFPWEGASDVRIRAIDNAINEKVELMLLSLQRTNVIVTPSQAKEADWAQRMALLFKWYLHHAMADEYDGEIELLANYLLTFGSSILAIGWLQELCYEMKTVKLEELTQTAQQMGGPEMVAQIAAMLFDPAQKATVLGFIRQFSSFLTNREAEKVLRELLEKGETTFRSPRLAQSRPCLTACMTMQDVIFPANTFRLQRARFVAQRELLTEIELREKAAGPAGWDDAFVEEVLNCKGNTFNSNLAAMQMMDRVREVGGMWSERWSEAEDLYEVWHFYTRAQVRGVPALFRTVLHPSVGEHCGAHEVLDYAHGEMPFVEFLRERQTRSILASRGLPEILATNQDEIKVQRDSRVDRSSITTMPPILDMLSTGFTKRTFGPGVVMPVKKRGDVEVMQFGAPDPTSLEVEKAAARDLNEYVGRAGEGVDEQAAANKDVGLVNRWLRRWNRVGHQILSLAQQYTPPTTIGKIVGLIPQPMQISRETIAGDFTLLLSYDARLGSPEYVWEMIGNIEKFLLPMDSNATLDRDTIIRYGLAAIDPTLADIACRPSDAAMASEIEDEQVNLAKMVAGTEPPMKPKGQNYQARLQVLQNSVARNPEFFNALAATRPDFQAMFMRRMEFLQQQVVQQHNKVIGIYGTNPSPGSPGAVPLAGGNPQMPQMGQFSMGGTAA